MDGVVKSKLTHKSDTKPHKVVLKVFWVTKKRWTAADIADYQRSAKGIAEKLIGEKYWTKDGEIHRDKFTCEDFAIRVLCQYAASKGLPVKLTTGTDTYRNMEPYDPEKHDRYVSDMWGFAERAMLTYGARDMQRVGKNTVAVGSVEELAAGDILAKTKDIIARANGGYAHHIQLVAEKLKSFIFIYQGNSTDAIRWYKRIFYKIAKSNPADPQQAKYGGMLIENGVYTAKGGKWDYENKTTGKKDADALKDYAFFRWNFMEFNK